MCQSDRKYNQDLKLQKTDNPDTYHIMFVLEAFMRGYQHGLAHVAIITSAHILFAGLVIELLACLINLWVLIC